MIAYILDCAAERANMIEKEKKFNQYYGISSSDEDGEESQPPVENSVWSSHPLSPSIFSFFFLKLHNKKGRYAKYAKYAI